MYTANLSIFRGNSSNIMDIFIQKLAEIMFSHAYSWELASVQSRVVHPVTTRCHMLKFWPRDARWWYYQILSIHAQVQCTCKWMDVVSGGGGGGDRGSGRSSTGGGVKRWIIRQEEAKTVIQKFWVGLKGQSFLSANNNFLMNTWCLICMERLYSWEDISRRKCWKVSFKIYPQNLSNKIYPRVDLQIKATDHHRINNAWDAVGSNLSARCAVIYDQFMVDRSVHTSCRHVEI